MRRPRRRQSATSDPGPDASATSGVTVTLDEILDGRRPGPDDPERDALWLELRRELSRAQCGHQEFDPREVLRLEGLALARWFEGRREWARQLFADDPRNLLMWPNA